MKSVDLADPPDRVLVSRFLEAGDERAFRALYRRHSPYLYPLILRLLGGFSSEADDVLQETWVRAAERLEGFRWESALRTWLCGISILRCREVLRARRRDPARGKAAEEPAARQGPRLDRQLDLEGAVRELPDGYREVLVLHDIEGHTHEEIASRLAIEVGTSKSQLSRARASLRRMLGSAPAGRVSS